MPPPSKRRKTEKHGVEEIAFDPTARHEYLTGFHKRKLERTKLAKETAEKKARDELLEARRKLRQERKENLDRHLAEMNAFLENTQDLDSGSQSSDGDETGEQKEASDLEEVDHEAEYIDEEKYTTVVVETMDLSAGPDGTEKPKEALEGDTARETEKDKGRRGRGTDKSKNKVKKKEKRKKFRYETKSERRISRMKETSKNSREAKARRAT